MIEFTHQYSLKKVNDVLSIQGDYLPLSRKDMRYMIARMGINLVSIFLHSRFSSSGESWGGGGRDVSPPKLSFSGCDPELAVSIWESVLCFSFMGEVGICGKRSWGNRLAGEQSYI